VWETLNFAYICQQGFNAPEFHLLAEIKKAIDQARQAPPSETVTVNMGPNSSPGESLRFIGLSLYMYMAYTI
jgi:hypothetical protein